jgi:hypothetical protein
VTWGTRFVAIALTSALLAGCGGEDASGPSTTTASSSTSTPTATASRARTPELDAIGAIGHSGATGANSTGTGADVPENSWITGTNPKVDSIYQRLLARHPALAGHNWNEAQSGTRADSLMLQADALLSHDPVPDIVFIVSIDNDILCDGTDDQNVHEYGAEVAAVVDHLQATAPGTRVFFNDTPFSVHQYDAALMTIDGGREHIDWPGSPCDPLGEDGTIDPAGERYQQQVYDDYYGRLQDICAARSDCATDGHALQDETFTASAEDFADDLDHLSVRGLAREAAVVWRTLPPDWK